MIAIVDDVRIAGSLILTDGKLILATETKVLTEEDYDNSVLVLIDNRPFFMESNMIGSEMIILNPFIVTESKNILQGDYVLVEYTDGTNPSGHYDHGILTRIWDVDDGPYCRIDDTEIDLAGEGHSSNTYKVLALQSEFPEKLNNMIVRRKIKTNDLVSLECTNITREELREITFGRLDIALKLTSDEEEQERLNNTKTLFDTLEISMETLEKMHVVKKPIIIDDLPL